MSLGFFGGLTFFCTCTYTGINQQEGGGGGKEGGGGGEGGRLIPQWT